jgi:hypothetical protein
MHFVKLVSDLLGEQANVINDFLHYLVLNLLVSRDKPHVLTAFYAAIKT